MEVSIISLIHKNGWKYLGTKRRCPIRQMKNNWTLWETDIRCDLGTCPLLRYARSQEERTKLRHSGGDIIPEIDIPQKDAANFEWAMQTAGSTKIADCFRGLNAETKVEHRG